MLLWSSQHSPKSRDDTSSQYVSIEIIPFWVRYFSETLIFERKKESREDATYKKTIHAIKTH